MKQEIKLTEALGKTLKDVAFSYTCGQAVLVFTDGTFSTLGVLRGYEPGDESVDEVSLELNNFGDAELIRVGVTTEEELNRIRSVQQIEHNEKRDAADRAYFERLKKKFSLQ